MNRTREEMLLAIDRQGERAILQRPGWQTGFILVICLGIALCEYIFAYQNVILGIGIGLALVLIIYICLSVFRLPPALSRAGESLALIPLYILFTSSLPWFFLQQQYVLPAVYACILAICFWHISRNDLSLKSIVNFDRRKLLRDIGLALAIGIPLGFVEYLILHPAATAPSFQLKYLLRDSAYMLLFVGLGEELLFRGLIQQDLTETYGWKWGLLGASVLFAVMHMTWRSVPELGFVFVAALVLGGLYIKTKSLTAPILLHAVNNVILVAVLPYLLAK